MAYAYALDNGLPVVAHAGETCGPEVIWDSLNFAKSVRIGHGVRCLEDPSLVAHLRDTQTPLEVCPSSNVCLGVFPSWPEHPLKKLMDEGLYVTLNSDDPPMFSTTLTDEFARACDTFEFDLATCQHLVRQAAKAALVTEERRAALLQQIG